MERVIVMRGMVGICHMLVCVERDATDDEILSVCNRENPSGTTCGWTNVVREGDEMAPGPVECSEHPNRLHMLVSC